MDCDCQINIVYINNWTDTVWYIALTHTQQKSIHYGCF